MASVNGTYENFDGSLAINQTNPSGDPGITVDPGDYLAIAFKIQPQNRFTARGIDDLAITYTPVPEPNSVAILAFFAGGLILASRSRRFS